MLEALEKTMGIVVQAAKITGIAPKTHREWMDKDPEYKKSVEDISEIALDFAESSLLTQVKNGIPVSTIYYLNHKGKKRGYGQQTQELTITELPKIEVVYKKPIE